jgi:3-oxoacyl-[acyl-carrier protein] reductase
MLSMTGSHDSAQRPPRRRGIFLCCRALVLAMKQQLYGKIINISSGTVLYGAPDAAHYVTSKAGVIGLTRSLARELGEYDISGNAISRRSADALTC